MLFPGFIESLVQGQLMLSVCLSVCVCLRVYSEDSIEWANHFILTFGLRNKRCLRRNKEYIIHYNQPEIIKLWGSFPTLPD